MVAMIAMKTVYYGRREYRPGQEFDVRIDREVDRLVRANKAKLAPAKPAMIDLPAMKAEEAPGEPKRRGRPPKYLRRDMVATDGQTGEEIPLPSSLQDLPSEEPTSPVSEEESAS
jgi:hypothetical protein